MHFGGTEYYYTGYSCLYNDNNKTNQCIQLQMTQTSNKLALAFVFSSLFFWSLLFGATTIKHNGMQTLFKWEWMRCEGEFNKDLMLNGAWNMRGRICHNSTWLIYWIYSTITSDLVYAFAISLWDHFICNRSLQTFHWIFE